MKRKALAVLLLAAIVMVPAFSATFARTADGQLLVINDDNTWTVFEKKDGGDILKASAGQKILDTWHTIEIRDLGNVARRGNRDYYTTGNYYELTLEGASDIEDSKLSIKDAVLFLDDGTQVEGSSRGMSSSYSSYYDKEKDDVVIESHSEMTVMFNAPVSGTPKYLVLTDGEGKTVKVSFSR